MRTLHIVTLSLSLSMILFSSNSAMEKEITTQRDPNQLQYIQNESTKSVEKIQKYCEQIRDLNNTLAKEPSKDAILKILKKYKKLEQNVESIFPLALEEYELSNLNPQELEHELSHLKRMVPILNDHKNNIRQQKEQLKSWLTVPELMQKKSNLFSNLLTGSIITIVAAFAYWNYV